MRCVPENNLPAVCLRYDGWLLNERAFADSGHSPHRVRDAGWDECTPEDRDACDHHGCRRAERRDPLHS